MEELSAVTEYIRYPGEDLSRRAEIEERLIEAFDPQDMLEEIWLSEIATLTSSIEYYRELEICKNREIIQRFAPIDTSDGTWADYLEVENPFHIKRIIGNFDQNDIKHLASIIEVTARLSRERERLFAQFERKRCALLVKTIDAIQLKHEQTIAIEALSD